MNAFVRGRDGYGWTFRALHHDTAASLAAVISAACYQLHVAYGGADDLERADMTTNVSDIFNLVEVRR